MSTCECCRDSHFRLAGSFALTDAFRQIIMPLSPSLLLREFGGIMLTIGSLIIRKMSIFRVILTTYPVRRQGS